MRRNRRWLQVGGWLLLLVFVQAMGLPLSWVLGVLLVWGAIVLGRRLVPQVQRASSPGVTVCGAVEPPTARHAYKPATTLTALIQRLVDAQLGAVKSEGATVRVALPDGEWATVFTSEPTHVTQVSLRLEGSSVQALALTCDALAAELGPMRLSAEGVTLEIDGTRPRGLLLTDVASAVETAGRRARAELQRFEREQARPKDPKQYLH